MNVQGINHICFSVSDLDRSIEFYRHVFGAKLLVTGRKMAYFDMNGLWIALNQEDIYRSRAAGSYTNIAFTVSEEDFDGLRDRLNEAQADILPGRARDERDRKSIYFLDPDRHLFEFHTGSLQDRLDYYRAEKEHMVFYPE